MACRASLCRGKATPTSVFFFMSVPTSVWTWMGTPRTNMVNMEHANPTQQQQQQASDHKFTPADRPPNKSRGALRHALLPAVPSGHDPNNHGYEWLFLAWSPEGSPVEYHTLWAGEFIL
ncbi:hypothetical protein CRUP_033738 [Coryphaenoides rupestris]|nr:hypothetical protein CRUP_033738 [Coryphaenoides rupestris]